MWSEAPANRDWTDRFRMARHIFLKNLVHANWMVLNHVVSNRRTVPVEVVSARRVCLICKKRQEKHGNQATKTRSRTTTDFRLSLAVLFFFDG